MTGNIPDSLDLVIGKFARALKAVPEAKIEHNVPLINAARLEKPFRRCFLYHEDFSEIIHDMLVKYASEHPYILTDEAKHAIEILEKEKKSKIYIAELVVPKTGSIEKHVTNIDLVSFRGDNDMRKTLNYLTEYIVSPLNLHGFTKPEIKGEVQHRYRSSHSLTERQEDGKRKITDIKVRQIAH